MNKIHDHVTKEKYGEQKHLYRYVPVDVYSLKSLNMGELFLNNLSNMNDIQEMEPYFNAGAQRDIFEQAIAFNEDQKLYANQKNYLTSLGNDVFELAKNNEHAWVQRYLKGWNDNNFEEFETLFNDMIIALKENTKITSLSEDDGSNVMWGNYADNHQGIMFEYVNNDIKEQIPTIHLQKVNYVAEKHNAAIFFHTSIWSIATLDRDEVDKNIQLWIQLKRTNEILNFATTKSSEWKYEKEVRLVSIWDPIIQKNPIIKVKPKSVTLGAKINPANKEHIIHICQQNDIDVYQAYKDTKSKSLEICRVKLDLSKEKGEI